MTNNELFFTPQPTRSARARWAFAEAGVEYEPKPIDIFQGGHKTPEFAEVNPLTLLPVARFDGQTIIESAALVWIVGSTGKTKLVPEVGAAAWRRAIQWTVFAPAELDHLLVQMNDQRMFLPKDKRDPKALAAAIERFEKRADLVHQALGEQDYLLGNNFSVADICVGHSLAWAKMHGVVTDESPLAAYFDRLRKRAAFVEIYGPEIQVIPET